MLHEILQNSKFHNFLIFDPILTKLSLFFSFNFALFIQINLKMTRNAHLKGKDTHKYLVFDVVPHIIPLILIGNLPITARMSYSNLAVKLACLNIADIVEAAI